MKNMTSCTLTAALFAISSSVFAHTSPTDTHTEGTSAYNNIAIGHGCTMSDGVTKKPITAQYVLFPHGNAVASYTQTIGGVSTEVSAGFIANFIEQGSLGGLITGVQDRNIFQAQGMKYDWDGETTYGFYGADGNLDVTLRGLVPFRLSAVNFLSDDATTPFNESCAKSLKLKIAVADVCDDVFPPREGTANLWIPDNNSPGGTSRLAGISGIDGIGSPATLTINRKNSVPSDGSCDWSDETGTHTGFDINIWPYGYDIDWMLWSKR